jgi:AraC family transcriptional regulator
MVLVDFGVEITVEVALRTENVIVFVGANPYPPQNCVTVCPGHYLLTMSITPRPPEAWAKLGDRSDIGPLAMGELMLIPPDHAQRCGFKPQAGWRRDIFCLFPQHAFETFMGAPIEWTEAALYASVDVRDANIHTSIRRLAHEAFSPGMATSVLTSAIAMTVAVDLRRYFANRSSAETPGGHTLSAWQLKQIRDFIYAHSDQDLRLSDFANICGLSVRHLTRAFKRSTGLTLAKHVTEIRLAIAKQLLRNTKLPAKVIASRVGFSNVSSFASAFRKLAGTTPGIFRDSEKLPWHAGDIPDPARH